MGATQATTPQEVLRFLNLREDVREMYSRELNDGSLKGLNDRTIQELLFLVSSIADSVGEEKLQVTHAPSLHSLQEFSEQFLNDGADRDEVIELISRARETLRETFGTRSFSAKEIVNLCLSTRADLGNCDFQAVLDELPSAAQHGANFAYFKPTSTESPAASTAVVDLSKSTTGTELAELDQMVADPLVRLGLSHEKFTQLAERIGVDADQEFQNALVYLQDTCGVTPDTAIKIAAENESSFDAVVLAIVSTTEASEYLDVDESQEPGSPRAKIRIIDVEAEGLDFDGKLLLEGNRFAMSFATGERLRQVFVDLQADGALDDGYSYAQAILHVSSRLRKGEGLDERLQTLCNEAERHSPPVMTFRDAVKKGLVRK